MSTTYTSDHVIVVKRLQLDRKTRLLVEAPLKAHFIKGPISVPWLSMAAELPGKTLHVAMALMWLDGMKKGDDFKLTRQSLIKFSVSPDATTDGLRRLERQGLIKVDRKRGSRPVIRILK